MKSRGRFLILALLPLLQLSPLQGRSAPGPEQVVVVANLRSPDSLELAHYYVNKRGVPKNNLILLEAPLEEEISNQDFVETIWNPLRKELLARGFIDGELLDRTVYDGRIDYKPFGTHFRYLLLCKGIPLKLNNHVLATPQQMLTIPSIFLTAKASIDSELALIVTSNSRQISYQPNPMFQVSDPNPAGFFDAVSVCRLDAPTYQIAKRIVDLSMEGEKTPFLEGRAYIDLFPQNPEGNIWLKNAALLLRSYGYDVDIEYSSQHWDIPLRNDAPAIYLGWYQSQASGPAVTPHPSMPAGAIAGHIHSYSASTLSDSRVGWAGPLLNNGFAVTFGNVYEPYLQMTLRPDLFIELLLKGHCVGDASIFATPVLSWQNVTIGDPLYVPFTDPSSLDPIETLENSATDPYTAIICINRIEQKDPKLAKDKAIHYFITHPCVQIAFKIIQDFGDLVTPVVLNSVYDYMCTKQVESEELVPLYLTVFEKLYKADDKRCAKILDLLQFDLSRWSDPIQKEIRKMVDLSSESFQD